jgi:hypothetical protein
MTRVQVELIKLWSNFAHNISTYTRVYTVVCFTRARLQLMLVYAHVICR